MKQINLNIVKYNWLYIFFTIAITACNSPKTATQPPVDSIAPPVVPKVIPSPSPVQKNEGEVYQQALARADAANAIDRSISSI
jgi:hypothetical protein